MAIAASIAAVPTLVTAQSNPFLPPSRSGGLTREQVAEIVAREIKRSSTQRPSATPARPNRPGPTGPNMPGIPVIPDVSGMPSQPGNAAIAAPNPYASGPQGSPVGAESLGSANLPNVGQSGSSPIVSDDVIGTLLSDGGTFVGCVGATPVFTDKDGRRAYFTSKELRKSHVARRFARC